MSEIHLERCQTCQKPHNPSLVESGECIYCKCKTLQARVKELEQDFRGGMLYEYASIKT